MEQFPLVTNRSFRYLGVDWKKRWASYNLVSTLEAQLEAIKSIANTRNSSQHNILGRILNVKCLMVPWVIYKFLGLPSPPRSWLDTMQSLLNNYIWQYGPHYVSATRLYQPVKNGGLNMLNVTLYDKALKLSWLSKAQKYPDSFWVKHCEKSLSMSLNFFVSSNVCTRHLKWICKYPLAALWKSVLTHWCDVHFTKSEGNVFLMPLMYNSLLMDFQHRRLCWVETRVILE